MAAAQHIYTHTNATLCSSQEKVSYRVTFTNWLLPEMENRKMKPKYGRDLPPLSIDEIIQKLNDDNSDPDAQYHIVHSIVWNYSF